MNNIPKAWRIVHRQDGSVEIEVKQVADKKSLACAAALACLCLLTWRPSVDAVQELTRGNSQALFAAACLVALPFAVSYIFCEEKWIVAHESLAVQKGIFGVQKVRHYRSGHFEFVAKEHESGHSWSLKVCSSDGGQELFGPHSIAELDEVAQLLSQRTGWPLHEYRGP